MPSDQPDATTLPEPARMAADPTVTLPNGYHFGVTRYADLILRDAFPERFAELVESLEEYSIGAEAPGPLLLIVH